MPKDDLIYVGHMLDTARLAAAKVKVMVMVMGDRHYMTRRGIGAGLVSG